MCKPQDCFLWVRWLFLCPERCTERNSGKQRSGKWLADALGWIYIAVSQFQVVGKSTLSRTPGRESQVSEQQTREPGKSVGQLFIQTDKQPVDRAMEWFYCLLKGSIWVRCGRNKVCLQAANSGEQKVAGWDANGLCGMSCVRAALANTGTQAALKKDVASCHRGQKLSSPKCNGHCRKHLASREMCLGLPRWR